MKKIFISVLLIFGSLGLIGQTDMIREAKEMLARRGEIYFSVLLNNDFTSEKVNYISRLISIDKIENNKIWAYANQKSFNHFLDLDLKFELKTPPSMLTQPFMLNSSLAKNRAAWDFYPTYSAYLEILNQFSVDYPNLCEVVTIKTLSSGRKLMALHINDSLGIEQNEPEFLYTSSIHGDETSGYVLMLHLIDYLLSNYGTDEQATDLVNNIDIWINPLANPDGTYAGGNNTVFGATRGNANYIDLNRNYPDPEDGNNPDGHVHQEETIAFMDFAEDHHFVMSTNMHDGTEVCNYPWDTWSRRSADDDWWIYVCRQYADTAHKYSPDGYLTALNNGITNGYDWYSISGGRQDYMNYFHHCREYTLELSTQKLLPASQLEDWWTYNYRSLLNYMEQVLYGFRGIVTNSTNNEPIEALVFVDNHDEDETQVYSALPFGDYFRPIKSGVYSVTFSAPGFYSKTINNISIIDEESLTLNVSLDPIVELTAAFSTPYTTVAIGSEINFQDESFGVDINEWEWAFEGGYPDSSVEQNPLGIWYGETGVYDVSLKVTDINSETDVLVIEDYITVTEVFEMKDTTVYVCAALFNDTGGANADYSNDEDITMTFISFLESGQLKVIFREFDLESSDDCTYDYLEIFDGKDTNAPIIGRWCGTDNPGNIIASNIDGALTFRFRSNSTIARPGWVAEFTCDTNVGVRDIDDNIVTIFPNPANNFVTIKLKTPAEKVTIVDLTGKEVLNLKSPHTKIEINLSELKAGIYLLSIIESDRITTRKLLKN